MSVSIIGAKRKAINYEFIDLNEDKTVNHGKEKKMVIGESSGAWDWNCVNFYANAPMEYQIF